MKTISMFWFFFFNYVKSEAILIKDKKGIHPDMYYFKIAIHLD